MVVALGIDENGVKMALSIRQGGTENENVIKSLFDDMENRGLQKERPILFVIDGSKAIHAAIIKRFENYFIQRCREHKKRNIIAHAPVAMRKEVEARIDEVYAESDYDKARSKMESLARWAGNINPDMAGSVREGLDETLTIIKLEVSPLLYKTLYSTNPIESLNSTFERFTHRVKKWRGGDMKKRWLAAAILKAEERMHRVRGALGIVALVKKMESIIEENPLCQRQHSCRLS
jgi:transposase-like protein